MSGGTSGAMLIGAGISAGGQISQGMQAKDAAKYNAAVASQNAEATRQQGDIAVAALRRQQAMKLGSMTASYGASGVSMEGSPMDVLGQSAAMMALDRLTTKYNYDLKALGYDAQVSQQEAQGSNALTSSLFSAAGTLAKGAGTYSYMS